MNAIPWTDRASTAVTERARKNAESWRHDHVCSDHILIGLTEEMTPLLLRIFAESGIIVAEVLHELFMQRQQGPDQPYDGIVGIAPVVQPILEHAEFCASEMQMSHVNTGHLLLGLLFSQENQHPLARQMLLYVGLTYEAAYAIVKNFGTVEEE